METPKSEAEIAARVAVLAAEEEHSLACTEVWKIRKKWPDEARMTDEQKLIWLAKRVRQSNALKAVNKARKDENYVKLQISEQAKTAIESMQKVKELLKDIETPTELQKAAEKYNPLGKPIHETKDYKDVVRGLNLTPEMKARLNIREEEPEKSIEEIDTENEKYLQESLGEDSLPSLIEPTETEKEGEQNARPD